MHIIKYQIKLVNIIYNTMYAQHTIYMPVITRTQQNILQAIKKTHTQKILRLISNNEKQWLEIANKRLYINKKNTKNKIKLKETENCGYLILLVRVWMKEMIARCVYVLYG